jgi:hypothetical protein
MGYIRGRGRISRVILWYYLEVFNVISMEGFIMLSIYSEGLLWFITFVDCPVEPVEVGLVVVQAEGDAALGDPQIGCK